MAGMMEKIGEKLHMGGHHKDKKEEEKLHATTAQGQAGVYKPGHAGEEVGHHGPGGGPCGPMGAQAQHEGPLDKIKHKVKGGKKKEGGGGGSSSSSSSESDGEGGRRKKNRAARKAGVGAPHVV